jgi:hypothetical protein
MPTAKTQAQTSAFPVDEFGAKAVDAAAAIAEANQRVFGQLLDLSSSATTDGLRTLGELQSAAAEVTRGVFAPVNSRESFEELRHDPLAWYRKSILSALDGAQRTFKLLETSARIVTRDSERMQVAAERSAKEIQQAVTTCASRLRELYATQG